MNDYESGSRKIIPATLIYAKSIDAAGRNIWLMMERGKKEGDVHAGKFNGLGGKLEAGESALEGAAREFHEEAGVQLPTSAFQMRGVLQFPLFKFAKNQDWLVFVFEVELPGGLDVTTLQNKEVAEGRLQFFSREEILNDLPLWPGDLIFLPAVFSGDFFSGCFRYGQNGVLTSYEFQVV